jgi:hypothetical protein
VSAVLGNIFSGIVDDPMFHELLNVCIAFVFVRVQGSVFDIHMLTNKRSKLAEQFSLGCRRRPFYPR